MINSPFDREPDDILERLKHPAREAERRKADSRLRIRNVLNTVFILLALTAMAGIVAAPAGKLMTWYGIGLFAVLVKMVEVMLRMPGVRKK